MCHSGAIIDVKTGAVYDIPESGEGYDSRANSSMLIVNPPYNKAPDKQLYYYKNIPWDVPAIYVFNETAHKFIKFDYARKTMPRPPKKK